MPIPLRSNHAIDKYKCVRRNDALNSHPLCLQVVPGSRVDDVTATRQMMTFDPHREVHPGSLFSSASKHKLEWKMGDVVACRMARTPPSSCPVTLRRGAALCQEVILLSSVIIYFCKNLF